MATPHPPAPVGADANLHGTYAGMISRGLAWTIDVSIVSVASVATFWVLGASLAIFGVPTENCTQFVPITDVDAIQHNLCRIMRAGEYFFALLLPPVYFAMFWWLGGQTIGMGIVGLRVIRAGNKPITVVTALLRLVGYVVAIIPLGLGFIWALFDSRRQGWHDKIAGTFVIYWRIPRRRMQKYIRATASPTYKPATPSASPIEGQPAALPDPTAQSPTAQSPTAQSPAAQNPATLNSAIQTPRVQNPQV